MDNLQAHSHSLPEKSSEVSEHHQLIFDIINRPICLCGTWFYGSFYSDWKLAKSTVSYQFQNHHENRYKMKRCVFLNVGESEPEFQRLGEKSSVLWV